MEIQITEEATQKLKEKIADKQGYIKLKYDNEGCCAVSGVPVLWFVDKLEEGDEVVKTDGLTIYIEKSKTIFYDEKMKLDFSKDSYCFQLKSPNQILNGHMSFVDKTI
ncbi:iron-sulfur cluster biosynthesis family protein [Pseudoneobacillus sp. C159]